MGVRNGEHAHLKLSFRDGPAHPGGQGEALHARYPGLRVHNGQGHLFAGLVVCAGSAYPYMRHAFFSQRAKFKAHQLVTGAREMQPLHALCELYGAIGLHGNGDVLDALFQGEDIHRHGNLFPAAQLARKGANHHERTLHGNGLLGTAEGAVVRRHHHHADAAHVLRQLHLDHIRALGRHRAGCKAQHHRVKAVVLAGAADGIFVTANGREGREPTVPGAHYVVVQVPGSDAQGFHLVHTGPGVRCLEGRQIQQAFVHNGQRIGHGPAVFFRYFEGEFLFRMQFFRQLELRNQPGPRVLHPHALYPVQAQREVVERVGVGLHQGNVHVHVGSHFRRNSKAPGRVFLREGHPLAAEHPSCVLQRHQRPGTRGGRNVHGSLLAHGVGGLVRRETEHGEGLRILTAGAAFVVRPVHQELRSADVTRGGVTRQEKVFAPIVLGNIHMQHNVLDGRCQGSLHHHLHGVAVHVGIQPLSADVPPPVPAHLIQDILQRMAFHGTAFGIDHGQADGLVPVCFQVLALRQLDAHVGAVRGEGEGLGGEALVAALFFYGGDHKGFQHAGGVGGLRETELRGGTAVTVQPGGEELRLGLLELGGGVVEGIGLKALELGAFLAPEGELGVCFGPAGCPAGEPLGRYAGLSLEAGFQHGGIIDMDFEPVGLDGLNVKNLVEGAAAHFEIGVPVAGGVCVLRGDIVGEEAVFAGAHHAAVELPFRGIKLQGGRMAGREAVAFVGKEHVHVEGVAGAPDAAFAVDKGLEPLLHGFPAHVKAAQGTVQVHDGFKVGRTAARLGHNGKGLMLHGEGGEALSVRFSLADTLELVVVHLQLGAGQRLAGDKVRGGHPQPVAAGVFGHKANIRGQELHHREAVRIHVIGRLGGVVGIFPAIEAPVIVVVPVIAAGLVPDGVVLGR